MARRHSQNSIHDMFLSLYHGNRKLLTQYKTRNGDLDIQGPDGNTMLIKAIIDGNVEKISDLLCLECNVNVCDKKGSTPLSWCVRKNRTELAKLLIDKGADVNRRGPEGKVALTEAVTNGNVDMVKLLLERGADCNGFDNCLRSPLLYAFDLTDNDEMEETILKIGRIDLNKHMMMSLSSGYDNIDSRVFDKLLRLGANPFEMFDKNEIFKSLIQGELAETDIYKGTFQVKSGTMLAPFVREYGFITSVSPRNEFLHHLLTCDSFTSFYRVDVEYDLPIIKRYIRNVLNVIIRLVQLGLVLPSLDKIWQCKDTCSCSRIMRKVKIEKVFQQKVQDHKIQRTAASLFHQCRTTIRVCLGMNCSKKVNDLVLPQKLKEFLIFEGEM